MYKKVLIPRHGSVEYMQIVEQEETALQSNQARIRVLASMVSRTDIIYRHGKSPIAPKPPFTPGYQMVGEIIATGSAVNPFNIGDRVAALLGSGGNTEQIILDQEDLVLVPKQLPVEKAVILVLNYTTAYQLLHRMAKVKSGEKMLVIGASGGVGMALLELGKQAGLKMYGLASQSKFEDVSAYGATPMDYRNTDFVDEMNQLEPEGIQYIFDGVGRNYIRRGLSLLAKGGQAFAYAPAESLPKMITALAEMFLISAWPNHKSVKFFGISMDYARDKTPFKEDLSKLFELLVQGKINPQVHAVHPLKEAAKAHQLLESGEIHGNIVLLT